MRKFCFIKNVLVVSVLVFSIGSAPLAAGDEVTEEPKDKVTEAEMIEYLCGLALFSAFTPCIKAIEPVQIPTREEWNQFKSDKVVFKWLNFLKSVEIVTKVRPNCWHAGLHLIQSLRKDAALDVLITVLSDVKTPEDIEPWDNKRRLAAKLLNGKGLGQEEGQ